MSAAWPDMDALVRDAAELAYTTLELRSDDQYMLWRDLAPVTRQYWCEAVETALAYALKQLFPEGQHDASPEQ